MQMRFDVGAVVFFTVIFTDCVVAHDYVAYLSWTFKLNNTVILLVQPVWLIIRDLQQLVKTKVLRISKKADGLL